MECTSSGSSTSYLKLHPSTGKNSWPLERRDPDSRKKRLQEFGDIKRFISIRHRHRSALSVARFIKSPTRRRLQYSTWLLVDNILRNPQKIPWYSRFALETLLVTTNLVAGNLIRKIEERISIRVFVARDETIMRVLCFPFLRNETFMTFALGHAKWLVLAAIQSNKSDASEFSLVDQRS